MIEIELFRSPYCTRCESVLRALRERLSIVNGLAARLEERDVLQHIDRAVELGILQTPALVIDGTLVQQGHVDASALEQWLSTQVGRAR
ncbi:MAG: thioredoxin family protein [Gammaproteobacteria bacterium]|nr:thioredoxin family protein [Gammaproteobacteria bacterium]